MAPSHYRRFVLAERPAESISPTTFRLETLPFDLKPGPGEALVQVNWIGADPANRTWLRDERSYLPVVNVGDVMRSIDICTVVEVGEGVKLKPGDVATGVLGWREYGVFPEAELHKIDVPEGANVLDYFGPFGLTGGMTSYFGLFDKGKLKSGDTLVVSAAAGTVGALVCQMGKIKGAKVIAIAGSEAKCQWLKNEIGVDAVFNYKDPSWKDEFVKVGLVDVFFDNVGGDILDFMLTRLNTHARVVLCGLISTYNDPVGKPITNLLHALYQRVTISSFIVTDYMDQIPAAIGEMMPWVADGRLKTKYQIFNGFEKAPTAMESLFTGESFGKPVVKVA